MLSQWGRPTTTGQTDNKRSNTNASEGIVRELIPKNKSKNCITLVTTFFQPLSYGRQAKVTNADTTTNCIETTCSDSNCSEDSISKSEPEASQMSISESIEA